PVRGRARPRVRRHQHGERARTRPWPTAAGIVGIREPLPGGAGCRRGVRRPGGPSVRVTFRTGVCDDPLWLARAGASDLHGSRARGGTRDERARDPDARPPIGVCARGFSRGAVLFGWYGSRGTLRTGEPAGTR